MKGIMKPAFYMRLSKDDELYGDSVSIETQRIILEQFNKEQGFPMGKEYVDDGWTGTNFERPNFVRMIDDINNGKINCVITKDLSRFGREHIEMDFYLEHFFPEKGVRFIAITDNEDSDRGLSDFVPFKNLFNEQYAKDTSKKVKAALKVKAANGEQLCTYAPLGYKKDPNRRNHLVIDEENRWIVEQIFDMAAHGMGAAKIVGQLIDNKVPTSAWLNFQRYGYFAHIFQDQPESKRYQWSISQVKNMLIDEVYIGNSIYGRHAKVSYKSKKIVHKPREEWKRVEGTHEPIIDKEVFDLVQQQIVKRRRPQKDCTTQIFAGLLQCADCGWNLRFHQTRKPSKVYRSFMCGHYAIMGKRSNCTSHHISYEVLYSCVLSRLQYWAAEAQKDEKGLLQRLLNAERKESAKAGKDASSKLRRDSKRLQELDTLFAKLYEDHILGKMNERNFSMLSEKYQQEQAELEKEIEDLNKQLAKDKQDSTNAQKWVSLISQYTNLEELSAELLNTLIEKIIIHDATKDADGNKEQEIEIYYRFVGKIDG